MINTLKKLADNCNCSYHVLEWYKEFYYGVKK